MTILETDNRKLLSSFDMFVFSFLPKIKNGNKKNPLKWQVTLLQMVLICKEKLNKSSIPNTSPS